MTDNFYFLFLDEIYTPNLNEFLSLPKDEIFNRKNHWHFGIAAVIIAANCLRDLNFKSRRIKEKFYPKINNLIFHYNDILNETGIFSDLHINLKKKKAFTSSLSSFLDNSDFKYTCAFVDKHELIKNFGIFDISGKLLRIKKIGSNLFPRSTIVDYNLYLLCLKRVLQSFYNFITKKETKARGVVIAEARGEREDTELREAFHKIHCSGIGSIKPTELRSIILDLFVVPKKQNYIGTQVADLILYPTYDAVIPSHNIRIDHFISYIKILKKKHIDKENIIVP